MTDMDWEAIDEADQIRIRADAADAETELATDAPESPPQRIDPDTLVRPLMSVSGPLPAGTGLYNSEGHLIAVLGETVQADDDEFEFKVSLNPPPD